MENLNLEVVEKFIEEIRSNPSLLGCTCLSFFRDFMTSHGCELTIPAHKPGKCTMCTMQPRCPELHTCPVDPSRTAPGRPAKFQRSGLLVEGVCSSTPDFNRLLPETPIPQPVADAYKLCFEKTSPLWAEIESMDVFHKTQQKPHFNNLTSYKASMREGEAIGSMVTFVEVAKNASKLNVDTPKSRIKDDLEVLVDLERSGFDVQILRERLTWMLSLKDKEEMLRNQQKQ